MRGRTIVNWESKPTKLFCVLALHGTSVGTRDTPPNTENFHQKFTITLALLISSESTFRSQVAQNYFQCGRSLSWNNVRSAADELACMGC